jgi:phage-related holin
MFRMKRFFMEVVIANILVILVYLQIDQTAITVFAGLVFIDFLTGLMKSYRIKTISSNNAII